MELFVILLGLGSFFFLILVGLACVVYASTRN